MLSSTLDAVVRDRVSSQTKWAFLLLWLPLLMSAGAANAGDEFLLSKGKAGTIETGMEIDALYAKVDRHRTKLVDRHSEGFFTPVLEIYLREDKSSRPSIVLEIVGQYPTWLVGRITVYDGRFKTEKGIGVGFTLGEIRKNYKVDWIGFGEGPLCARVNEIGMTFALDFWKVSPEWYKTRNQALIPDSAKVTSVFVVH